MVEDSGLRIMVEREPREKFLAMCRIQDRPAAQVIREFMRGYVAEQAPSNDRVDRKRLPREGRK